MPMHPFNLSKGDTIMRTEYNKKNTVIGNHGKIKKVYREDKMAVSFFMATCNPGKPALIL
jgi:hypothetical protein